MLLAVEKVNSGLQEVDDDGVQHGTFFFLVLTMLWYIFLLKK